MYCRKSDIFSFLIGWSGEVLARLIPRWMEFDENGLEKEFVDELGDEVLL